MQKLNNFTPAHARIGLDRVFIKSLQLDPNKDFEVDETDKFENDSINDSNFVENILLQNSQKLSKYKGEGCICIYDEKIFDFPKNKIFFSNLLELLINEDNSIVEIDRYKGRWIDSINQMIAIENLKSFSENLFKFDPLFPLNIQFESRFESGNLRMAIKVYDYEYDLIVNNDTNSGKASNWFYFRFTLRNTGRVNLIENPKIYKFNIINCLKTDTLFSKGLKVLSYSTTMKKWTRRTKNNYYFLNGITNEEKRLYTLTFTYKVDYNFNEENLYFAYCFPYSYTNLQNYLSSILNNPVIAQKNILRHEIIGKSLSENNLDMVIITKFDSNFDDIAYRPCIVLTGRVHPGESNSSYAIQGVVDFLIDFKNPISEKLRKNFIFKIIPMLNPDGVINGNFRTSLIGKDLNRLWDDPKENYCPTIFYTKEMMKKTLLSREIYLFCDFHGHSNKPNFFLYGCPTSRKLRTQMNLSYQEMILSKIYSTKNDMFDHKSCIYKIVLKKMKTARAVVKNELNIEFSYCLESSIGYISIGEKKFSFFTPKYYNKIGCDFCISLNDLTNKEIFMDNLQKIQVAEEAAKNATLNNNNMYNNNQTPYFNNYASNNINITTNFNSNNNNGFQNQHSNSFNNLANFGNKENNSIPNTNHSLSLNNINVGGISNYNENFSSKRGFIEEIKTKKENPAINKDTKEKENKFFKDKEYCKHIIQNKDKIINLNNNNQNINNKDRDQSSNKNNKHQIKIPKDNSDINFNLESNRVENDKDKEKQNKNQKNKEKDTKEKNNLSKSDLVNSEDKKKKKKKKKLNPLKTKKLFMTTNAFENPNNTSISINPNISNNPSLSSSFLNANTNLVEISKLPKNLVQITEKMKSNKTSLNSSKTFIYIKNHPNNSFSSSNNNSTPSRVMSNNLNKISNNKAISLSRENHNYSTKNNVNNNNLPNCLNQISEEYVKKVTYYSVTRKINDNLSRERENSLMSSKIQTPNYSEREVKRIASSTSNFNNLNEIKTNYGNNFLPDFNLKMSLEKYSNRNNNNFTIKTDIIENSFKCSNNQININTFSPIATSSHFISGLRNTMNGQNGINMSNILNSVSPCKNQMLNINMEKSKTNYNKEYFIDSSLIPDSNKKPKNSSNKNLIYPKFYDKNDNNNLHIDNKNQNIHYDKINENTYFPNTNSHIKSPNNIGVGLIDINLNINNSNIKTKKFFMSTNTMANNNFNEINDKYPKGKSINSKIIDPSKIYLTPTQKIFKILNENQTIFGKHISKNK